MFQEKNPPNTEKYNFLLQTTMLLSSLHFGCSPKHIARLIQMSKKIAPKLDISGPNHAPYA